MNGMSKLQTHPLVRKGAPQHEDRKCQIVIKMWSRASDGSPTPRQTDQLAVGRKIT
jgi:hypothetical protein